MKTLPRSMVGVVMAAWLPFAGCTSEVPTCCADEGAAAAEFSELSLYQLRHEFVDQAGVRRTLADFQGAPVLMVMIFTNCSYACPAIVADVKRVVAAPGIPGDLRVVFVSMDPERDSPAVLAKFAKDHALASPRYTLLRGEADAVAELAAVLGVRYARVEGGQFSHSNLITLLDRAGQVHHRHEGLATDVAPLVAACIETRSHD